MPLDWSLFYLTGHFDQPHFHAFQFFQCDCRRLELKHETMMYRNKFIIVCFTVSASVSNINDRSKTDFERAKIKLTGHFDRRLYISRYFEPWLGNCAAQWSERCTSWLALTTTIS
jgi:hypothetical protein